MKPLNSTKWVLRWCLRHEPHPEVSFSDERMPEHFSVCGNAVDGLAVFDGYLFDTEKLQHDLNLAHDSSNAAIVKKMNDSRGDGNLFSLQGGFVFAIWDSANKRLTVVRDPIGLHPCYYFWDGKTFFLSSVLDAVLAQPQVSKQLNRAAVAEHLLGTPSLHQRVETFYSEVKRLPPAHRLQIEKNALNLLRYWDPVPCGFEWASDEELARFEPLLEKAVSRCISVGADSIALSGGFDSVSLAVLVADQLEGKRLPHALSLRNRDPRCDEGPTQTAVAKALGMPLHIRTLEESIAGRHPLDASLALSSDSPSPVLSVWQSFYTGLFNSAPAELRHLVMGTGGDDLLTVDLRYGADCLATLKPLKLWRFLRNCQRSSPFSAARVAKAVLWDSALKPEARNLVSRMVRSSKRGSEWLNRRSEKNVRRLISEDLALTLVERRHSEPAINLAPGERSYVAAIRGLLQAPLLWQELEQGFAWAESLGFTLLFPYFDKDLFDVLLRAHPEHLLAGGKAKAPLRRLVAQRLPTVALPSKKVDFSQMVHDMLRPRCEMRWQEFTGQKVLVELGISSAEKLDSAIREYAHQRSRNHHLVWRILSTETWLRRRVDHVKTLNTLPTGEQVHV